MASRYSRYDPDRRSRSPRDRSPDRFDSDRRRPSIDVRSNSSAFPSNRDGFGDAPRREPPRGPRALIDPPSGPRGGFAGDFRGRGRGRGRGWSARDDSRDRGRDRDIDFRDRYRDERSRERDRDRDRDWRDSYRSRRSPIARARSPPPPRDFRDRDRDGAPGLELDRSRRDSRDGAPLSGGSPSSESHFGPPPTRGSGFPRGRGRGGRGDWGPDRPRGRVPYDDRSDRYPRSRSQEGRWGRDRDDRERGDRYPEAEPRRDLRDERDRGGERELFRAKMEARAASVQEPPPPNKEVSPPPVAPSAPAFGSVPNRGQSISETQPAVGGTGKAPPTAPRAFAERQIPPQEPLNAPVGPSKPTLPDSPLIPVGPRAQQQKIQRPSSKQWINPNLKKAPDSPKSMRAQALPQQRPGLQRRESSQPDQPSEEKRPRSSDSKATSDLMDIDNRRRSQQSAEPGEIMSQPEDNVETKEEPADHQPSLPQDRDGKDDAKKSSVGVDAVAKAPKDPKQNAVPKRKRKRPVVKAVRFEVPPKPQPVADQASDSDDEEDMADYFDMEIEKTEAELNKLQKPKLPLEVVARFASMSHGAMVKILNEREGLAEMLGDIPDDLTVPRDVPEKSQPEQEESSRMEEDIPAKEDVPKDTSVPREIATPVAESTEEVEAESKLANLHLKSDAMDVDNEVAEAPAEPKIEAPASAALSKEVEAAKELTSSTATGERTGQLPAPEQIIAPAYTGAPLETTENESKQPSTPSQVEDEGDDDETESEDEAYVDVEAVRQYMTTPPVESLPQLDIQPWDKDKDFLSSLDTDPAMDQYVLEHLQRVHLETTAEQALSQKKYAESYLDYLKFTMSDDPIASRSRDKFSVGGPVLETLGTSTTPEPKPEGRSGRRFASERDLERVLQASMREEDERREREMRAQKEKYRGDKEAVIPDMLWNPEDKEVVKFHDESGHVPTDRLVSAWRVLPPVNNFTDQEAELFEKRYLELPKQWGKIAEVIPNRDFGTCIQYYYLRKKDLNLKEKLKKQPKKRKKGGRGKQRSSALVSELGNGEPEGEETNDTGENGESRRRPRRAAAPTWGFEQPTTESENGTPVGTPGNRRGASTSKTEHPEKVDGRKGRRKAAKDKEAKVHKPQALAAAPAPGTGRSRSRTENKAQNVEFQAGVPGDVQRPPGHLEPQQQQQQQQQQQSGMQPPFTVQQPLPGMERSQPLAAASSMADVMAPPSLRPEPPPPPQPAMTTFNLAPTQPERKAPTQASSYWSVSEASDFPNLLKAFGSDWTAIAAHMGSKTAVMVKNYYVRQKEHGKPEWEALVQEADAKRARGEKRPDPPTLSQVSGRGRRYDSTTTNASRPLAAAPGALDLPPEPATAKETGQQPRPQGHPGYNVPIAQAPTQQQPLGPSGQKPLGVQQSQGQQPQQQPPPPPASQAMSPNAPPLRAPLQPFGFPEREREQTQQPQQRVPLPQKANPTHHEAPRPLAATQPLHPAQADGPLERGLERQKLEIAAQQQQQQRDRERERERERIDREREREAREREMLRQAERQTMRVKAEAEMPPQHQGYDAFGHRHQGLPPRGEPPRADPLSLSRHPQEPPRHGAPQSYPSMPHTSSQPVRSLLSDPPPAQSPPLGHPSSRPVSALQQRQSSGSAPDIYGAPGPRSSTPASAAATSRPPEPKKSNIMSLLNDDPPPPPKRVSDVTAQPSRPSPTPPPQGISRQPPVQPPPSQLRREPEPQYSPYGRPPSAAPSAMPPLKPTYAASPQSQHAAGSRSSLGMPMDSPSSERDYYRQHPYQPGHPSSGTNSPQTSHRYPPPGQPGQSGQVYQPQAGYPTSYGSAAQPPHAASPPPQYPMHGSASRPREMSHSRELSHGSRESWPGPNWAAQPPKTSQAPPPSQSWAGQHGPGTPKASTPTTAWATALPPQQPHHPSLRDDRGPPMYGSQQQPPPPHQMPGRYPPPSSRGPEPVPPPAQAYRGYASTPAPGPPRDPRDIPGRSYTPYDGRGQHPPPGPGYPGPDPRDLQLRESRDPRDHHEMIARGLRPHEFDRRPEHYGR